MVKDTNAILCRYVVKHNAFDGGLHARNLARMMRI